MPLRSASNNYSGKPVYSHKLVLLGDMGVGKTCISIRYVEKLIILCIFQINTSKVGQMSLINYFEYRYAYGKFSSTHEATIGGCFLTKDEELDDHIVKYEIWDTAGQERYHSLAQMYYK